MYYFLFIINLIFGILIFIGNKKIKNIEDNHRILEILLEDFINSSGHLSIDYWQLRIRVKKLENKINISVIGQLE